MLKSLFQCPICNVELIKQVEYYKINELFLLWKPIEFSHETINEHLQMADATQLYKCDKCRLEIFLPQIIGSSSFYIEAYNLKGMQSNSEFTYSEDKWDFEQAGIDIENDQSRVIEIGCGNGNFLEQIQDKLLSVAGVEYNLAALETAKAKGLNVCSPEDIDDTYVGKWDAVVSFHVLEHVGDPVKFVREMASLAKPDGLIGISVPNQDGPIKYIRPCVMNMPPHHATRWCKRSFEALAHKLDLEITRVTFEPLLLENHSYYSVYWVKKVIPGKWFLPTFFRQVLSGALRIFFGTLYRAGIKTFPLLKGQSIYVAMKKRK